MTEQEFLNTISQNVTVYWEGKKSKYFIVREKNKITLNDFFYERWCTGGITGGSCYGNDHYHNLDGEDEPNFKCLDIALEKICPTLTFLQYKKLLKDIEERDEYTEGEYYGNSTNYTIKKIVLNKLYNKLKEMEVI